MESQWKKIEVYGGGKYEVSNTGLIRANYLTIPPKVLNTKISKNITLDANYDEIEVPTTTKKKKK